MPLGERRVPYSGKRGIARIAAEMSQWLATSKA
jgi:hypothetical protein